MKVLAFGLGALGTVFAVSLKNAGYETYAFIKENHLSQLKQPLRITGLFGEKQAVIDGYFTQPNDLKSLDLDLIILTVKAFDTEKALLQIKEFIKPNTLLLIAQNGYGNYEKATQLIPKNQIILSRIIFGAKLISPGVAKVTVFGDDVVIGQPENTIPKETLENLAKVFTQAGIPTRVSEEVYSILWEKIIYNSALNPLGALLERTYGELAENYETRFLMDKVIEEIFEVLKAYNIKIRWDNPEDYKKHFYQKLIPPTAAHYPSMYYDLKNRKKTEIDALNGAIVNLAEQKGLKTPVNKFITLMVKQIETNF
ncbi:2-dehydropantoate 2-reductase [Thermodesulfobacterium sp. TA1]|uniref:ketopantoate reductase family protein n=1 Tax=Thermodesulfobacterium sp. TA1 TaxID=2234087 RepID=UPI001232730E|nr:2-dehydropantoate 2-reductase [Thermodesulfobacterium sp. TA1]QER42112.1 2-dehydropantoate 2-reductase [Thermodesulfobacterium sp. TA1]